MATLTDKVREAVYQQTVFLSELQNPTLEDLLVLSKHDRRVRNVTPLFAAFYEQKKWREMGSKREVFMLQLQFLRALRTLEKSKSEAASVASELRNTLYKNQKKFFLVNYHKDVSFEMAKLLQSLVRGVKLEESLSGEDRLVLQRKLDAVDFNRLFKSQKTS